MLVVDNSRHFTEWTCENGHTCALKVPVTVTKGSSVIVECPLCQSTKNIEEIDEVEAIV